MVRRCIFVARGAVVVDLDEGRLLARFIPLSHRFVVMTLSGRVLRTFTAPGASFLRGTLIYFQQGKDVVRYSMNRPSVRRRWSVHTSLDGGPSLVDIRGGYAVLMALYGGNRFVLLRLRDGKEVAFRPPEGRIASVSFGRSGLYYAHDLPSHFDRGRFLFPSAVRLLSWPNIAALF